MIFSGWAAITKEPELTYYGLVEEGGHHFIFIDSTRTDAATHLDTQVTAAIMRERNSPMTLQLAQKGGQAHDERRALQTFEK